MKEAVPRSLAACGALLLIATGSCGSDKAGQGQEAIQTGPLITTSTTTGDGEMTAEVHGVLRLENGCLQISDYVVIWPDGTRWDAAKKEITLPDGQVAPLGAVIDGGGGYLKPDATTYLGTAVADAATECSGPEGEVIVLNPDGVAVTLVR